MSDTPVPDTAAAAWLAGDDALGIAAAADQAACPEQPCPMPDLHVTAARNILAALAAAAPDTPPAVCGRTNRSASDDGKCPECGHEHYATACGVPATPPAAVDEALGEEQCCSLACFDGACETCPCCGAGYCLSGIDGVPTDEADRAVWFDAVCEQFPVVKVVLADLAASASPATPAEEAVEQAARRIAAASDGAYCFDRGEFTDEEWADEGSGGHEDREFYRLLALAALNACSWCWKPLPARPYSVIDAGSMSDEPERYCSKGCAGVAGYPRPERRRAICPGCTELADEGAHKVGCPSAAAVPTGADTEAVDEP